MQDGEVGPGLGAGNEEQPELGPPETKPLLRLPRRAQAPRGPCGQANDISPRGTQSGRVSSPQVKSLAPMEEHISSSEAQGCQRNLSSYHGRGAAPAGGARKQGSNPNGLGHEAEQPNEARSELVPPPPLLGDASVGGQARRSNAATSEQMSDTGSSDESSIRSDESGEQTTPLRGAVHSPSGREGQATEANGGKDHIERPPLRAAAPEQRDGAPCASEEPKAVMGKEPNTQGAEPRSLVPNSGGSATPAAPDALGAERNPDVQPRPVATGSGIRAVSVRLERPGGAEDANGPPPSGWSLQPQNVEECTGSRRNPTRDS